MATTVIYNGKEPWKVGNYNYPPYVSIDVTPQSFGQNWHEVHNIQLQGKLSKKMLLQLR